MEGEGKMKKTQFDRRAFIDRLEKKYIKKVQLHAFKRESELLKQKLTALRGTSIRQLHEFDSELLDMPTHKLTYS